MGQTLAQKILSNHCFGNEYNEEENTWYITAPFAQSGVIKSAGVQVSCH